MAGYDLMSEAFFRDPYPTLRRMQQEDPIYYWEPMKSWVLTRYEHISTLLRDPRFSSQRARPLLTGMIPYARGEELERMITQWSRMLFFLDPPRHTRIRSAVNQGMTLASLEALRPAVAAMARRILAAHREQGMIDIAEQFADAVSLGTLTTLLGIPEADRARFRRWASDVLKPAGAGVTAGDVARQVMESSRELFEYLAALANQRQERPGDDLMSRLLAADAHDPEFAGEISIQCAQVLAGGYVTVANQITNTVLCLLKHPTELQRLREDPGLLKGAVEEALRYEPAALTVNRLCMEDLELGGKQIKKGEFVFGVVAAANRDPELFPDADRFDIGRKPGRSATFGSGPHYCLGAALTRLEVEESLRALLELPGWEFGEKPYEYTHFNLQDRGPKTLLMRFRARS